MPANILRRLARFRRQQSGSVAIIFSLSLLALAMASGLAIDYARSTSTYDALQQDLDATLLFVGRQKLLAGQNGFDAQDRANRYFKALKRQKHAGGNVQINISEPTPGNLKAVAKAKVPTTISRLFGVRAFSLEAGAEVALGDQPVEVALVLDNTASMAGAKLQALQAAAKSLVQTAYEAERADQNVRIGIVPFGQYVNVGQANRNAPWMSVPLNSSLTGAEVCYDETPVTGTTNCRMVTQTYMVDGFPQTSTSEVCDYQYGPPVRQCYTPVTTNTWYGCAGSRAYPLETLDENYAVRIPGVMNASCPSEIAPLSNDKDALAGQIDGMTATGDTYIPSGLIWGWRMLSKAAPYEDARGYNELVNGQPVRKLLVLMTDGKNTLSPTYPAHDGSDAALADTLTSEICRNMKGKGIEIYTIAFQVPDNAAKAVLQECASGASKFFDAGDGAELDRTFREIARDFNPLRLIR